MKTRHKHLFFCVVLFLLALVANYPYHTELTKLSPNDSIFFFYIHEFIKTSIVKFHEFPQWIPYYFGGMPFFANAQSMVFTISGVLSLILSVEIAMNITFIIGLFLAGLFMYLLGLELLKKEEFAFISAIIYMFNGWPMHNLIGSGLERFSVYFWFPLIFLFCIKAFNNERSLNYSILTGIILAFAFHGAGIDTFIWFGILVALFFVFEFLICNERKKMFFKIIKMGLIILLVFFGLIAIKLLPLLEFSKNTNKSEGFSLDESFQNSLSFKESFKMFFSNNAQISYPINIGFIATILVLLGLFRIKNRYVSFLLIVALLDIIICMNKSVYYILWKFIPGFSAQHDVTRSLFLVAFCCSVIAGFGAFYIYKKIETRIPKKIMVLLYIILVVVILVELNIGPNLLQKARYDNFDFRKQISNNYLLQNISKEGDIFRINNLGTNAIGGAAGSYAIPLKLQILYGYNNVWVPEYFNEYLGIAHREPAKFYGMLNTKWIYTNMESDISDFKFEKKFENCKNCYGSDIDSGIDGPYLYYNQKYLPRAYIVNKSILVIGEKEDAKKIMYHIMLNEIFNPANTVIILGNENLNSYSGEELRKYSLIVLSTGSIEDMIDSSKLKDYVKSGGYLFPDVTKEGSSYEMGELLRIVKSIKGKFDDNELYLNVKESNITDYTLNKMSIKTDKQKGFLVISEKFFMFNGWKTINLQKEILRANGINSAVYLDGSEEELSFIYRPKTFIYGEIIFFITIICLIAFFVIKKMGARVKNE